MKDSVWTRYSYAWITGAMFLWFLAGHWLFAWLSFVQEQAAHGQPVEVGPYVILTLRDEFENMLSEAAQLLWQVVGLAYFFYRGSPASKDGGERLERKVDEILREVRTPRRAA
jgi:hypothetical protein